jgi:hypothetical protein
MKKLISLLALGIFLSACSPFAAKRLSTPTPTNTPIRAVLIATFTPPPIPTDVPTFEPNSTVTGMDLSTPTMEESPTRAVTETSTPAALIISMSIDVEFTFTSCSKNLVTFNGAITSNNETDVEYKWQLAGTSGGAGMIRKTNISTAGTITVHSVNNKLGCGNYTISLQIIYPNPVTEKKSFSIP